MAFSLDGSLRMTVGKVKKKKKDKKRKDNEECLKYIKEEKIALLMNI